MRNFILLKKFVLLPSSEDVNRKNEHGYCNHQFSQNSILWIEVLRLKTFSPFSLLTSRKFFFNEKNSFNRSKLFLLLIFFFGTSMLRRSVEAQDSGRFLREDRFLRMTDFTEGDFESSISFLLIYFDLMMTDKTLQDL